MKNIVEMNHITKTFPGIIANDDVTISLREGEILALLGENGAGKSTLMSMLFGMYQPDSGEIMLHGNKVEIKDPKDATDHRIGMVHQHFKLVHNFTVTQNIVLGVETVQGVVVKMDKAREEIIALSQKYNLNVDPDAKIEDISVGMQQRVEILKLLYRQNEVLIFDEPTAVLTPQEIDELLEIMIQLQNEGKSIIFITHKLNEIKKIADRVSVLRKGVMVGTHHVADLTIDEMSELMVGRKIDLNIHKKPAELGETVLDVEGLTVASNHGNSHAVKGINFKVQQGEIVSIAGVEGNGQRELIHALAGMMPTVSGTINLLGNDVSHKSIRYRNTHGMSHIPEDRHRDGLVLDYRLDDNLVLKKYFEKEFNEKGFIKFNKVNQYGDYLIEKFDIRSSEGIKTKVRSMSGGNQQKAILAREIDLGQDLLMAVQPTRGLDVGAISTIHHLIVEQRDQGKAVLLVSYELSEIMNLSDRILVIHDGELVGEFKPEEITQQELGLYMAGAKRGVVSE
ncbi:ABC transporter ATP-binding protein [Erysipelothrix urinaevulpis]|uniref:ABC transporter ATP-binding protein n=1 Tax=Erysipelothrix urinaevulpis TaxID=2683717 RepID=UPI00135BD205|nr:ABC transporter ATP-binding protein [Erysipelothrix urinaevulpis]